MKNIRYPWHIVATFAFGVETTVLASHMSTLQAAPLYFWLLVGLATFRMARTISFNAIGEIFRKPFTQEVADSSGAGNNLDPKPGAFYGLGELITCPICSGTHSAAFLLALYSLLPTLGLAWAMILGVAGISELIHWFAERAEWEGRAAREQSGTDWLLKNRGHVINAYNPDQTARRSPALFEKVDIHDLIDQ